MASCSSSSASKSSCSGSPCSPYVRIPNASPGGAATTTTTTNTTTTSSSSPSSHHNHHHPHSHSHQIHARSQSHSHRHYHLPPATATATTAGDSFDDSSSSLSSTPSSATIVTSSSSSTSEELIPGRLEISAPAATSSLNQQRNNNQDQSSGSKNRKNSSSKRKGLDCQQMNDLNAGTSTNGMGSASRRSRKPGSECPAGDRNSSPAFHTGDSWTTFHFGPQNVVTTTTSTRNERNGRLSPRCESEHYGSSITALEQRMRTSTLGSSNGCSGNNSASNSPSRVSNGKAVAVIKGTASTSRLSSNSFNGSSSDWKKHLHSHEIRKLKRELDQSEEKVSSLTSQLTTHSHMVTAFEQSLASMSLRLQQMTSMSSQKDSEIQRLKSRIEELKIGGSGGGGGKGGHESRVHTTSGGGGGKSGSSNRTTATPPCTPSKKSSLFPHNTCNSRDCDSDSHTRVQSSESHREGKSSSSSSLLIRRHTFVSPLNSDQSQQQHQAQEQQSGSVKEASNHNRWFKAFRRTPSGSKKSAITAPSPAASSDHESGVTAGENGRDHGFRYTGSRTASIDSFSRIDASLDPELVTELKRQLREKEKTVTDLRLEALTSAHQLQSLEELVTQLRAEIVNLRSENERLSKSTTPLSGGVNVTHHKVHNNGSISAGSQASSGGIEWPTSDEASGYASITSVYFGSSS